jgi:uncharacterized membrane protein
MVAVVTTIVVVYIYSHDVKEAFTIGISANIIKMILYYIHERVWNKIEFGRAKPPEYQI